MQKKRGAIQASVPESTRKHLHDIAVKMAWFTPVPVPGQTSGTTHPHTSFAIAAAVEGLMLMPAKERRRILRDGAKKLFAEEERLGLPGRTRIRLVESDEIRPVGKARVRKTRQKVARG